MSHSRPPRVSWTGSRNGGSSNGSASRRIAGSCSCASPRPVARCSTMSSWRGPPCSSGCSIVSTRRSSSASRRPWPTFGWPSQRRSWIPAPAPTTATNPKGGIERLMEAFPTGDGGFAPTLEDDPALGLTHREKLEILFAAMFGIAFVAGPLIGGWLTENLSWHWIFYVNIPIGIVALVVIQRLLPTVKTPSATRNFDLIGGAIFTVSMVFLLVGLTNKQFSDWSDPTVGGFIAIGVIGTLLFIVAERFAKEPIIPLDLWKGRTYSATMVSVFFAAFAFFGAIVFLPRWFQVVEGFSPTNSGLAALPLMVGLIFSSIVSGLIVSRTGRYKWLIVGSVAVMGFAVFLMTNLTKDTPVPMVWLWMFIAGLGVGPTFSVPTIVIQNAVPFRELGVATSNLTFFRQIGGTVSLAFVGTIFGTTFVEKLPSEMTAAGVPDQIVQGFSQAGGSIDLNTLTGTGQGFDLGAAILAGIPEAFRPAVEPFIANIIQGLHGAFSLATAQTFWLGVVGAVVATVAAVAIKEIPLRATNEAPVPTQAVSAGSA